MIQPHELMIGNYVKWMGNDAPDWIEHQIEARDFEEIEKHPNWYTSIPLNKEWLIKLGFIVNTKPIKYCFDDWIFPISWSGRIAFGKYNLEGYIIDGLENKPIQYVHQLQNLYLSLTGEQLKIKE